MYVKGPLPGWVGCVW